MPVVPWRRASVTAKGAVELRERLKAYLECNLADAKLGVDKQVFRLFHSHATTYSTKGMPVALRNTSLKCFALRLTACAAAASDTESSQ